MLLDDVESLLPLMNFPSASKFYNIICVREWFNPSDYANAVREHRVQESKTTNEQVDLKHRTLQQQTESLQRKEAYRANGFPNESKTPVVTPSALPQPWFLQSFTRLQQAVQFYTDAQQRSLSQFKQLLLQPSRLWQNQTVLAWVMSILTQANKGLLKGQPTPPKDEESQDALEESYFQTVQQPKLFSTKKVAATQSGIGMG